jgi:hypothetical protein
MKKSFLFVIALSIFSFAYSQTSRSPIGFGVKAGVNFAKLKTETGNIESKTASQTGLNAGVFAEIPAGVNFTVQPELTYSSMGYEIENSLGTAKGKYTYLSLPVLLKYTFPGSGFGVYAGPQLGYLLSATRESNGTTIDEKDRLKSTDFSAVFGSEFTIPNSSFVISGRYQMGLKNIVKDNNPFVTSTKNNTATVTLGYRF